MEDRDLEPTTWFMLLLIDNIGTLSRARTDNKMF